MKSLAMKCNQTQFSKIKPILLKNGFNIDDISDWSSRGYLINDRFDTFGEVTNYSNGRGREQFETWDMNTFLAYCDIVPEVDYTIPGTILPTIPTNTPYLTVFQGDTALGFLTFKRENQVSFGGRVVDDKKYILFDDAFYPGSNYFMVEQWIIEELATKEKPKKQEQKITGYKLIKPEYEAVAAKILNSSKLYGDVTAQSDINALNKAGVLNLWFKPVCKPKEETINIGFDVKIKDKRVYHKNEDITDFVKGLVNTFKPVLGTNSHGGYHATLEDVTFSKTGCENKTTKLSDWLEIYNKIK